MPLYSGRVHVLFDRDNSEGDRYKRQYLQLSIAIH